MSEVFGVKDSIPADPQNGGPDMVGLHGKIEKPVEDALAVLESAVKEAALEKTDILNESDDKLDEFSRLELEMAELDKTDDDNIEKSSSCTIDSLEKKREGEGISPSTLLNKNDDFDKNISKAQADNEKNRTPITNQNGQTNDVINASYIDKDGDIGHADLIAVLKGDSIENQLPIVKDEPKKLDEVPVPLTRPSQNATVATCDSELLIEGVTIEGEGEYQIMEVVDEVEDETENILPSTSKVLSASLQSNKKLSATNQKLTPEEERAMAMEQIAGLNARVPRRRKQDIKPLQFETSELVSTIGADWSEDEYDDNIRNDTNVDGERPTSSKNVAHKQTKIVKKESPTKTAAAQLTTAEEVTSTGGGETKIETPTVSSKKRRNSSASTKVTNVVVVQPVGGGGGGGEEPNNEVSTNTSDNVTTSTPETTGATGFKRTRTIKRRIIWDPDAPETTFSYAKLVRSSVKERSDGGTSTPKPRSVTPKEIIPAEKKAAKRAATPSQSQSNVATKSNATEKFQKTENIEMPTMSKQARRSQTISPDVSSTGSTGAKKKNKSEVDRLMGDEGAANMLNSLGSDLSKLDDDSDNKPHKPLMRNRNNAVEKVNKKDTVSAAAAVTATSPPKAKRGAKPKASNSWDYVYQKKQQLNDDSMIIRRRSNSSYSSNASQNRLSLDGPTKSTTRSSEVSSDESSTPAAAAAAAAATPKKSVSKTISKTTTSNSPAEGGESLTNNSNKPPNSSGSKAFEFAKPKEAKSNQKTPKNRNKSNATLANDMKKGAAKRGVGRPPSIDRLGNSNSEQAAAQNSSSLSSSSNSQSTSAVTAGEEVIVRKIGKIAHVLFNMNDAKINCTFTPQLMNKIVSILNNLANEVTCHVVVVTTSSSNFCQGLDIANLGTGTIDQRKSAAIVLATATKNFLRTLATFPKPLVAGIHGAIIGLGVIQLPLFDVVVASDKTTFETPYAKIGQTPEGFCIWHSLTNVRETAKTKLLWLAEKMHSNEASASGLIDKLTTAERVNDDALNMAKKLSAMSTETYRHMKDFVVQKRLEAFNSLLDDEFDKITSQWTSTECFNKFKKILEIGHF